LTLIGQRSFGKVATVVAAATVVIPFAAATAHASTARKHATQLRVSVTPIPARQAVALLRRAADTASPVAVRAASAGLATWEPDPNPGSIPAYCSNVSDQPASRVTACEGGIVTAGLVDTKTGQVLGTTQTVTLYWAAVSTKSRGWHLDVKARPVTATGVMAKGTYFSASPKAVQLRAGGDCPPRRNGQRSSC
jgi:hypothetical protein